jgi:hypothetical protein
MFNSNNSGEGQVNSVPFKFPTYHLPNRYNLNSVSVDVKT